MADKGGEQGPEEGVEVKAGPGVGARGGGGEVVKEAIPHGYTLVKALDRAESQAAAKQGHGDEGEGGEEEGKDKEIAPDVGEGVAHRLDLRHAPE